MRAGYIIVLLALVGLMFTSSCRKDELITSGSAQLEFSADTITFDTVFTTVGSTTKYFKVYNPHNRSIKISNIRVAGGSASQFRLNIDGIPGNAAGDIEILAEDSLYIFVEVTVDPNASTTPYVIEDQIIFITNGNVQEVNLVAWGQNAHFLNGVTLCDSVWTDDKPYVIFNYVVVDSGCTLTIQEGVNVYFYGGASILVEGTLIVNGTKDSVVTFQGARLESFYKDVPGQWFGLVMLRGSTNSTINYAHIRNAVYGISVGSFLEGQTVSGSNAPDLVVTNTIIENSAAVGIFGFLGLITGENVVIYNCGLFNFQSELGGVYDFTHCTFANFPSENTSHEYPVVRFSDFFDDGSISIANLDLTFTNCIIYGEGPESELNFELRGDTSTYSYLFEDCMLRTNLPTFDTDHYVSLLKNIDPQFTDRENKDYSILSTSLGNNAGKVGAGALTSDISGLPRGAVPDMGAYETGD